MSGNGTHRNITSTKGILPWLLIGKTRPFWPELESIDQELVKLRKVIDAEHTRRKEIAH
ncbi:hypothetical protein [Lacrimispora sp. JR3]|uniref:hypothetical protein n=1 Tax=Lacrimispora sinapis TaxID=3111456 RepID=UPI0037492276